MFKFLQYLRGIMGQIVSKNTTLITEKIKSSDSEITINLNLTIKLDSDGALSIQTGFIEPVKKNIVNVEDKDDLLIPDIESGELIEFGRKVE